MSTGPLYHQTAEILRSRIVQNVWRQGDRLPSENQLCDEFGVSSITMRRAVATLVAEGLLVRLQGKGTFVSSDHAIVQGPPQLTSFTEDMQLRGWQSAARVIGFRTERAPAGRGGALGAGSSLRPAPRPPGRPPPSSRRHALPARGAGGDGGSTARGDARPAPERQPPAQPVAAHGPSAHAGRRAAH